MKNSLDYIFRPRSVAVIGASRRTGSIGREILHSIFEYDFKGMLIPINPNSKVIHSMKCYRSVLEIQDDLDMAVIVVPKPMVEQALIDCGRKDVKGIVMITAGYSETGFVEEEKRILDIVKHYKMRMVGPNCMGIINTHPDYQLNATFASTQPIRGNVGFVSQSGALGVAILDSANELNIGFSMFVSVGNKADISANDLLEYWMDDDDTQVVLLYLESFGNPRNFTKLARKMVKRKPIIAVKSGRTSAGARAAFSHTGALAGLDVATDALFNQCGVLRVNTVEEMFDLTQVLANQPLIKGNRVSVMSNAGGPCILVTDALVNYGMEMAEFTETTVNKLKEYLPPEASFTNPLDMIASADPPGYKRTMQILMEDENSDAVIVIFVHPRNINANEIAQSIADVMKMKQWDKPVLCVFMGKGDEHSGVPILRRAKLPVYLYPESAAMSITAAWRYLQFKERQEGKIITFDDVDKGQVAEIFKKVREENRERLTDREVTHVLRAYKFPLPASKSFTSVDDAAKFAEQIGYPVVLKLISAEIVHKTDVGGVILDQRNEEELRNSFLKIAAKVEKLKVKEYSVMVQKMIKGGREVILGMSQDPSFGPLIMFGLGGIYVEIMKDVSFAIHPITDMEAEDMVQRLKGFKLLEGVRGEKPVDFSVIHESLLRLSQLISDFHDIKEMDMNPFIVFPQREKCVVVDARISLNMNKD
ncbi:MAG: acetate--CoA ligase family protein [FCB group bacterium]|nr:acetate--CoA ligase family protein [FCB group bacterium]